MNQDFIIYTVTLVTLIIALGVLGYISWKKQISSRDISFISFGWFLSMILLFFINSGKEVNQKLAIENIPNEIVSTINVDNDTIINDTILYRYLIKIRAKHPEVILCQCKLESNSYKSNLFKLNKNLLGMKESSVRTALNDGANAGYSKYKNWRQCINDYVIWGYTHDFDNMSKGDYIAYLNKVYAEDLNYDKKLNKLMESINFEKLK